MLKTLATERRQLIVEMLEKESLVKVTSLVDQLGASEATIRRDLSTLEDEGKLTRVHGGARRHYSLDNEKSLDEKLTQHIEEKEAIAKAAANLVQDKDIIYLDAGTTTLQMVPHLAGLDILVVTNGIEQAMALNALAIDTIMLGGNLKKNTRAVVGSQAFQQLANYHFNKVFMGINAIHPDFGMTTPDIEEANIKQEAISQGGQVYFLADSSKLDKMSFAKVADADTGIVITSELSPELKQQCSEQINLREVKG
ncbi:DeoR/GlpR family DNA-binding transcription regulator [Aerococcus sanguinicola]|uniref:DeoR/GlpR family DNA-binding transcription regulator n=1 Tax=Aerococcus TaxID=1375 RepID=UPI00210FCE0B|nr:MULTISPECIES: DeoR/GlpR family DNA-binding transcription regulator [Aerococcus]MDK7049473.1 DeoR/GlpR family DNA-binding transcription regulator [Aerococcus sanguinicola]